jgi:hypothetical protein
MEAPLTESNYPARAGSAHQGRAHRRRRRTQGQPQARHHGRRIAYRGQGSSAARPMAFLAARHCAISERTEEFYMRVAKNRAEIEAEISEDAADVMLALSSDARRLFGNLIESEALLPMP